MEDAGARDDAGPRDAGDGIGADAGVRDGGALDAGGTDAGDRDAGPTDTGVRDAGSADTGVRDAGPTDAGVRDAGPTDAGVRDAGPADAGVRDAGLRDGGPTDSGTPDAGAPDAGPADAGAADGGVPTHTVDLYGVWTYAELVFTGLNIPDCSYAATRATGHCQFEVPHGEWVSFETSDYFLTRACHDVSYDVACGTTSCGVSYGPNGIEEDVWCYFPVVDDVVVIAHHARGLGSGLCSSLDCAALSYSCGYDGFGNSCGTCAAGETCNLSVDATSQHYSRCLPAMCP